MASPPVSQKIPNLLTYLSQIFRIARYPENTCLRGQKPHAGQRTKDAAARAPRCCQNNPEEILPQGQGWKLRRVGRLDGQLVRDGHSQGTRS